MLTPACEHLSSGSDDFGLTVTGRDHPATGFRRLPSAAPRLRNPLDASSPHTHLLRGRRIRWGVAPCAARRGRRRLMLRRRPQLPPAASACLSAECFCRCRRDLHRRPWHGLSHYAAGPPTSRSWRRSGPAALADEEPAKAGIGRDGASLRLRAGKRSSTTSSTGLSAHAGLTVAEQEAAGESVSCAADRARGRRKPVEHLPGWNGSLPRRSIFPGRSPVRPVPLRGRSGKPLFLVRDLDRPQWDTRSRVSSCRGPYEEARESPGPAAEDSADDAFRASVDAR